MFFYIFSIISLITGEGKRDFYDILGLKHDCNDREIDRSFQRLSRKYHPDKNKGNAQAAEKFTDINDAYGTLKDPLKRRVYDLYGEQGVHLLEAPRSEFDPNLGMVRQKSDDNDIASIVRKVGPTIRLHFPVDLIDFHEGRVFPVEVTRRTMCRCPTAGFYCDKCRGRPTMKENVTLTLVVEKGSEEGSIVLFKNAGDVSEECAPGDIEIIITSKKHPLFTREGSDLHMNVEVTLKEALLGFERSFEHFDGSELIIESKNLLGCGKTLKIPQKGLPKYLFPGEFGDVIVHTKLLWPKSFGKEEKLKLVNALK